MRHRLTPIAWIACAVLTTSCAGSPRIWPAARPPRLALPEQAARPCELPRLPPAASEADLDADYARRGAALVACDAARRLAVETLKAERRLVQRWLED